jgi:hypothetical protein
VSFGLTATLLLRLDGRMGEWVHVVELATHCAVPSGVVIDELEVMVATNLVRVERHRHTGLIERAMVNPRYGT